MQDGLSSGDGKMRIACDSAGGWQGVDLVQQMLPNSANTWLGFDSGLLPIRKETRPKFWFCLLHKSFILSALQFPLL